MKWRTKLSRIICPTSPLVFLCEAQHPLQDWQKRDLIFPFISPLTPNRTLTGSHAWVWGTVCFTVIRGRQPSPSQLHPTEIQYLHLNKPALLSCSTSYLMLSCVYPSVCEVTGGRISSFPRREFVWSIHSLRWPWDLIQDGYMSFKVDKQKSSLIWLTLASEMGITSAPRTTASRQDVTDVTNASDKHFRARSRA